MKNPFLIGDKVYLRPLELEDAGTIQPWINDPETTRFLKAYRPYNLQAEEEFIKQINQSETDIVLAIIRCDEEKLIGLIGLHQIHFKNRHANFGINIGDKGCREQGFGTEATALLMQYAFDTLNLHRVTLHVFEYNQRAYRVYEKLGFQKEGVLREENYREGQYWDTILMGILAEEWRQLWLVDRNNQTETNEV